MRIYVSLLFATVLSAPNARRDLVLENLVDVLSPTGGKGAERRRCRRKSKLVKLTDRA